jgi:BirA family transcriptional regulator, biotin operon repressor / biotin---[acetyl-CoA-carboxylase] ligase
MTMNIVHIDKVDSTNNYAITALRGGEVPEGTVFLTFRQTQGRGQAINVWESEPFKNLTFSLVLHPGFMQASDQFLISRAVSLGIVHFLDPKAANVSVKWPNDILADNRKIAGVLLENSIIGNTLGWTVAGIGLNLNQESFKDYLPEAVSLKMITGLTYDAELCLDGLLSSIMIMYNRLKEGEYGTITDEYHQRLYGMGQILTFRASGRIFEATIAGTDEYGRLVLRDLNGEETVWPFKGVEMVWKL